jgi:hypothetical protein
MMTIRALRSWLAGGLLALALAAPGPAWAIVRFVTAPCNNSGANSLRGLIDVAVSGDVISVPFCTLTLAGLASEDTNAGGDLDIVGKNLTIIGTGPGRTILDGGLLDRVFDIQGSSTVTLIGMTIRNGRPPNNGSGGGIRVGALAGLRLVNVVVSGNQNTPGGAGGAIASDGGAVALDHVILRDNASFRGGGLSTEAGATVRITNSVIADNRADSSGGGIFNQGVMTIASSVIVRNRADADDAASGSGGGIFQNTGQLALRRTVLARNLVGSTGSGPDCAVNVGEVLTALGATRTETGCGILTSLSAGDDRVGVNPVSRGDIVVGAGAGGGPHVRVFDATTSTEVLGFFAYSPAFPGGARVALCDLTGDGVPDVVTGAGPGGGPHVRAFDGVDGASLPGTIGSFYAYDVAFPGGVFVGCGDVNGDGAPDVITGAGAGGGPHVRVFSGLDAAELFGAFVFDPLFAGGVFVGP